MSRYGNFAATEEDQRGDGQADAYRGDTTGDGREDTQRFDYSGDGNFDTELHDTTGDGRADTVYQDTTGDGNYDSYNAGANQIMDPYAAAVDQVVLTVGDGSRPRRG
jgi:hypothetical protein